MAFRKAEKRRSRLRLAAFGPSGSGKTYTALQIATGICGDDPAKKIAVIDTEYGSAEKYADRFEFDTQNLENPSIEEMIGVMNEARDYHVLVIDSLSHPWQELLQEIDQLAKAKYRGNTWSAWSDGTPKQKRLVKAILSFPGHIIVTMRSKTEWITSKNDRGKDVPTRVGLAPEQGKGIEYEFDMLMEINTDHMVQFIKDRSGKFQDKIVPSPGPELGVQLAGWLDQGAAPLVMPTEEAENAAREVVAELSALAAKHQDSFSDVQREYVMNLMKASAETVEGWEKIKTDAQLVINKLKKKGEENVA
jgi:hypothetical protein